MNTGVTRSRSRDAAAVPTSPTTAPASGPPRGSDGLVGAMVDELRVLSLLGRGGMGTVYLAHDTTLDRDVALKLVGAHTGDDRRHRRFLSEARALAMIEHPNVVRIYRAAITSDGRPYLVQELIRGHTLDQLPTPVEPRRACVLAVGIARGLATAHASGILHRDIKPSNVMVNGDDVVKLVDFGISEMHARDPGREDARPPSGDAIVGTPRYLAPELWRGEVATASSDTYALGVVLYELLSGHPPYGHDLPRAVTEGPEPPLLDGRAMPLGLARLVARCIARDPAARPTIDELLRRLEDLARDLPALSEGSPYPGLSAYDAALRADFHGRDAEVDTVVERLHDHGLVTVTGDSGIGKSSLCRAGVLPAIVAGRADDVRRWRSVVITPGRRPLQALQRGLQLAALPVPGAGSAWAHALGIDDNHGVVVLIDQLEELMTVADPAEATAAGRVIAALAAAGDGVRVVTAVRGDFLTRVGALPELGPLLMRNIHLLRPLDEGALRAVVTGPARARGIAFASDAIVNELITPVLADPTTLPLLQFTLAALWERRDPGGLPAEAVRAVGGVSSAFGGHADRVLGALSADERTHARRIVLSVVDGPTRISRERDELVGDDAVSARALEALVAGRILVARDQPGDAPTYTLVHDALIDGWPRLRGWLDDRVGERAIRSRLRLATDDWLRAGRPAAHLWPRAAVAETARLHELTTSERAFLAASRRAARRSRMIALAMIAAVPLAAALAWIAVERTTRASRDTAVETHRRAAHREQAAGRAALDRAADARTAALALFAANGTTPLAEEQWTTVAGHVRDARTAFGRSAGSLEMALSLAPDDAGAHADLAAVISEQALIAEANHDPIALGELLQRLARHDRGDLLARWREPGTLHVDVAGALSIAVRSIDDREGRRVLGEVVATANSHELEATLGAGSYDVEIHGADGVVVNAPVLLARGEPLSVEFALPARDEVPPGFVFVPPGRFIAGTRFDDFFRRDFLAATPERVAITPGYLIARHEVTFGEWIEFLRDLPADQRELRRPQTAASRVLAMRLEGTDPYALVMQPSEDAYRAGPGEPLVYPNRDRRTSANWDRIPVSGVSFHDAEAYAAWIAGTGRVPRARLCTEPEWERAARGADGRAYPHGDRLDPDDANIDVTYGALSAQAFGPDEVGAHPASDSPFGVADLVGNVWEWVRGPDDVAMLRGGGWLHGASSALSANHDANPPTMRSTWAGIRICADPRREP